MKLHHRAWGTILVLCVTYVIALISAHRVMRDGTTSDEVVFVESEPQVEMVLVDTLRTGDTLDALFRRRGFTYPELLEIMRASRQHYNLNRVNAGMVLSVAMSEDGTISDFKCSIDDSRVLVVQKQDEGYGASLEQIPFVVNTRSVAGVIKNSLWETFVEMGEDPSLSAALSEVFAWQIDFNTDLRRGDSFRAIVEEKIYEGRKPVLSTIVAARLINRERILNAIRFEDPDGYVDHYDLAGHSLKRKFLRSPLRYTRISSGYSRRRFHPVLKIYRPHLGIDYAAPTGTPIVSVGDGVVIFAGRNGGYGRFVKIRHNSIYETTYGHLSRYARGIKKGVKIKQGQVIGYVGSSGLANGPHLDYRLTKNGRFVNPIKIDLPSSDPVKKRYRGQFEETAIEIVEQLENPVTGVELTRKPDAVQGDGS